MSEAHFVSDLVLKTKFQSGGENKEKFRENDQAILQPYSNVLIALLAMLRKVLPNTLHQNMECR